MTVQQDNRRGLPRTDRVIAHPRLSDVRSQLGTHATTTLVRAAIHASRDRAKGGGGPATEDDVVELTRIAANRWLGRRTRRVINATGVVLHTNLGRAPLGARVTEALAREAGRYVSLELDLESGKRGGRAAFAEYALTSLTGAEAALVVNNNAAGVLLALASVALGQGVLVSRGELVEIGGGFRVPEVLARSGAHLVEVGTTNRTRVEDYANALADRTDIAAILRVHPGNFRQIGFVHRPTLGELVKLGRSKGIAIVEDLGGGALVEVAGLAGDPTVAESVAAGPDIVTFSTDKILGGPQGGALVGSAKAIDVARKDPLARALRLGRLPLVALEATLGHYLAGELDAIPSLFLTRRSPAELEGRAARWAATLGHGTRVVKLSALTGGGTYAEETIPSVGIAIDDPDPEALLTLLRRGTPSVVARVEDGTVLCDARTVLPAEDGEFLGALSSALAARSKAHR